LKIRKETTNYNRTLAIKQKLPLFINYHHRHRYRYKLVNSLLNTVHEKGNPQEKTFNVQKRTEKLNKKN